MIALALVAAIAGAEPQQHCENLPTQAEQNRCSQSRAKAADDALTREWNRVSAAMKRLDRDPEASHAGSGTYSGALLASQRAWLRFRAAECLIEGYSSRGGTLQPMAESDCYTELTNDRNRQLRQLFGE